MRKENKFEELNKNIIKYQKLYHETLMENNNITIDFYDMKSERDKLQIELNWCMLFSVIAISSLIFIMVVI